MKWYREVCQNNVSESERSYLIEFWFLDLLFSFLKDCFFEYSFERGGTGSDMYLIPAWKVWHFSKSSYSSCLFGLPVEDCNLSGDPKARWLLTVYLYTFYFEI